jgi:hypothetical protein
MALWANPLYFCPALPAKWHPFRVGEITFGANHGLHQIRNPVSHTRNGVSLNHPSRCLPKALAAKLEDGLAYSSGLGMDIIIHYFGNSKQGKIWFRKLMYFIKI